MCRFAENMSQQTHCTPNQIKFFRRGSNKNALKRSSANVPGWNKTWPLKCNKGLDTHSWKQVFPLRHFLLGPIGGYTNAEWVLAGMDVTVPLVNNEPVRDRFVIEKKTQPCLDPPTRCNAPGIKIDIMAKRCVICHLKAWTLLIIVAQITNSLTGYIGRKYY